MKSQTLPTETIGAIEEKSNISSPSITPNLSNLIPGNGATILIINSEGELLHLGLPVENLFFDTQDGLLKPPSGQKPVENRDIYPNLALFDSEHRKLLTKIQFEQTKYQIKIEKAKRLKEIPMPNEEDILQINKKIKHLEIKINQEPKKQLFEFRLESLRLEKAKKEAMLAVEKDQNLIDTLNKEIKDLEDEIKLVLQTAVFILKFGDQLTLLKLKKEQITKKVKDKSEQDRLIKEIDNTINQLRNEIEKQSQESLLKEWNTLTSSTLEEKEEKEDESKVIHNGYTHAFISKKCQFNGVDCELILIAPKIGKESRHGILEVVLARIPSKISELNKTVQLKLLGKDYEYSGECCTLINLEAFKKLAKEHAELPNSVKFILKGTKTSVNYRTPLDLNPNFFVGKKIQKEKEEKAQPEEKKEKPVLETFLPLHCLRIHREQYDRTVRFFNKGIDERSIKSVLDEIKVKLNKFLREG